MQHTKCVQTQKIYIFFLPARVAKSTVQAIWRPCWNLLDYCPLIGLDDIQEAYNLIKDLVPTTPQVIINPTNTKRSITITVPNEGLPSFCVE